jgi:large subunit ribosomal protein L18
MHMIKQILRKRHNAARRAHRTRARIRGTQERPRLTVFRSLRHTYAQLIDDTTGRTLVASSDRQVKSEGLKPVEVAGLVGADIANKAKAAGIEKIVFDRGSYRFHGRVRAVAEAAREAGLDF